MVLGGGRFLTSEVPLYGVLSQVVAGLLSCGMST